MQPPEIRRVVITTSGEHERRAGRARGRAGKPRPREAIMAASIIAAAALATLVALFLTSRPYDPMNSTADAQQSVPPSSVAMHPTPKQSPTPNNSTPPAQTPEPAGETASAPPDDSAIQAEIEKTFRADPALSELDVSTIVEGGRVTVIGSVRSAELKQRVERVIRSIKGVVSVDNQLVVIEGTPQ